VLKVEAQHLAQQDLDILVLGENVTDGSCDLRRRDARRRHLIQKRLEGVMVLAIQEGDLYGQTASDSAAFRPPNPPPIMTIFGRAVSFIATPS